MKKLLKNIMSDEFYLKGFFFIFLVLSIIFSGNLQAAESFTFKGQVVSVLDGDTIKVMEKGKAVKIRLYGIDCPEKKQAFGQKAKDLTSSLVFGRTVTITVTGIDRYGRFIGKVKTITNHDVGEALLKAGLAWWYQKYAPHDIRYQELEKQARDIKVGLWADSNPVAPWKYRRK